MFPSVRHFIHRKFIYFYKVAALYEEQSNDMDIEEISQFPGTVKKKRILIGDKDIRVRRDNMEIVETLYNGACNFIISS